MMVRSTNKVKTILQVSKEVLTHQKLPDFLGDPNCIMDSTQRTLRQLLVPGKMNKIDNWGDPNLSHLEDQT